MRMHGLPSASILWFVVSSVVIVLLGACVPIPPPTAGAQLSSPLATPTVPWDLPAGTPTVVADASAPVTPTVTPAAGQAGTPTATRWPTVTPTRGPYKPILIEFGPSGGDGGTSYDFLYGREMPWLVLYTDGQLLVSGKHYGTKDWYVQKVLTVAEMCALLDQIAATGFLAVEGTGQEHDDDPIYEAHPVRFGMGLGDWIVSVNGRPSKWVAIYPRGIDYLIPPVKAAYQLIQDYRPTGMTAFAADRVVLRVAHKPGSDFRYATPVAPGPRWPDGLPSLQALLQGQEESTEIVLEGQAAEQIQTLMPLPGASYFTEAGESYFLVGRSLLPHEALDYYSVIAWHATTFNLPFQCSR